MRRKTGLHVIAARAANIHEIAVRCLDESLQLVLLGFLFSSGIAEIVHLEGQSSTLSKDIHLSYHLYIPL